jgi:hypothetical protein
MTQQIPSADEDGGGVVRRSISLPPLQDAAVMAFAKDSGIDNFSIALRVIITQWLRYEAEKAQRVTPNN